MIYHFDTTASTNDDARDEKYHEAMSCGQITRQLGVVKGGTSGIAEKVRT